MNKLKKNITVRFFSINANDSFFKDFISSHQSNYSNDEHVRIKNIRMKKHLIKIHESFQYQDNNVFLLSVVRERNTWQTIALRNGKISGIPINQGVIGDPYYYLVVPEKRLILGFTTGSIGSLASVAKSILQQFNKDRVKKIELEQISKENEFSKLRELKEYKKLYFKVSTSSLSQQHNDLPHILKNISSAPFFSNNSQIALTTEIGEGGISKNDLFGIVDFLSVNDGCKALMVHGIDNEDVKVNYNFNKAYVVYKTQLKTRSKFIDEKTAKDILLDAMNYFSISH